jgi:ABC-type transporter Mla subunit MlaD
MAACLNDMLDIQRATYRMLDNALYGTVYTVESSDPLIVSPDIPAVRQLSDANTGSLLDRSLDVNQLLQNALNGTITDRYADVPGIRAQLQSILDALTSGDTDLTTVISDLELIIGALA